MKQAASKALLGFSGLCRRSMSVEKPGGVTDRLEERY
jgi:hypothetical protein